MRVAGADLSLASTGLAMIDDRAVVPISTERVKSEPARRDDGLKPSLQQRNDRLRRIEDRLVAVLTGAFPRTGVGPYLPDLLVVEGPSYGSPIGAHEMGGNWWGIVRRFHDLGIPVVEVSPPQVKQYATGSGSTSGKTKVTKEMVISAVRANYGDVGETITRTDEADALILAAMGARWLGQPVESTTLPAANLAAMKNIRWPERTLL